MFRSLWFHKLLGINSRSNRRRQAAQDRRNVRLNLEGLEDRVTPATQTFGSVATPLDLSNDITFANNHPGTTVNINLAAGTTFNMSGFGTQEIKNGAIVNIIGAGGDTIIPQDGTRAFKVDAGATVSMNDLTISGGRFAATAGNGGVAIWDNGGALKLTDVSIVGNTLYAPNAAGTVSGGGIFANNASTVTITNSNIDGNSILANVTIGGATNGANVEVRGGGIAMTGGGTLTITGSTGSTISTNTIRANGASIAQGGGLYLGSGPKASLTNVTVDHNTAIGGNSAGNVFGGGITVDNNGATFTMLNSAVTNNTAQGGNNPAGAGGNAFGGGLETFGNTVGITNSTFVGNQALGGSGTGAAGGSANGGAISDHGGGTVAVINTTLGQNTALGGGGTTAGSGQGGGIKVTAGTARLINDTIALNRAYAGTIGSGGTGGGVWSIAGGATTATNTLVQGNNASTNPDVFIVGGSNNFQAGSNNLIGGTLQIATNLASQVVNGVSQQYFPLLANASVIGAGTTSVVPTIAAAQGFPATVTDQIGDDRTRNNGTSIDIGAVQFLAAASGVDVDFLTPPLSIPQGTTNLPSVTVTLEDSNGNPVTSGNLTLSLVQSDGVTPVPGIGTVSTPVITSPMTIPNVLTGPLALNNLAPGSYFIKVDYSNPLTGVTGSEELSLTVTANTQAPNVTLNPLNQTVTAGNNVVFTATAAGTPTPTVQWQVSTNGGATFTDIPGATDNSLVLTGVNTSQNGNLYRAVFTNSAGTATTTTALLNVNASTVAPVVTLNPLSQSVTTGSNVVFTATANGTPAPTVQWQVSTNGGATYTDIAGATDNTLAVNNVSLSQNGNLYRATFTNSAGSVQTTSALLTVSTTARAPTVTLNPVSQSVTQGNTVVFTATASGTPTPTVQWQYSFDGGHTYFDIPGATSTTLTLPNVSTIQSGNLYRAVFTNSEGSATTTSAVLTVTPPSSSGSSSSSSSSSSSNQTPSQFTALFTIAIDAAEFILVSHGITSFNGVPLPPLGLLFQQIVDSLPFAGPLATAALQAGINAGNEIVASQQSHS